mmetsp:Transcript_7647/g.14199  ORF Transcript_7647/g.14199 Transcript_7647/m.14199 type:complete len:267 (+) Transcript_7647:108-908(+)
MPRRKKADDLRRLGHQNDVVEVHDLVHQVPVVQHRALWLPGGPGSVNDAIGILLADGLVQDTLKRLRGGGVCASSRFYDFAVGQVRDVGILAELFLRNGAPKHDNKTDLFARPVLNERGPDLLQRLLVLNDESSPLGVAEDEVELLRRGRDPSEGVRAPEHARPLVGDQPPRTVLAEDTQVLPFAHTQGLEAPSERADFLVELRVSHLHSHPLVLSIILVNHGRKFGRHGLSKVRPHLGQDVVLRLSCHGRSPGALFNLHDLITRA